MAFNSKVAWQALKSDDARLPDELRQAVQDVIDAHENVERLVQSLKPAPKGRRWTFSYRYGVAIGLADAGGEKTSYFV